MGDAVRFRAQTRGCYSFGPFVLDVDRTALYRGDELIPLTPKVFDTLLALVSENNRTLTKNELVDRVWPDSAVGDGSLAQNILVLRRILDPYFPGESPIATFPKRGYRFVAPVTLHGRAEPALLPTTAAAADEPIKAEEAQTTEPVIASPSPAAPTRNSFRVYLAIGSAAALLAIGFSLIHMRIFAGSTLKRKSIAVLALKNLTARPESEWYSTAFAETVAGELGAGGDLRIISSDNVRRMQQELSLPGVLITGSQLKDIRNDIGCDLVLSGSYLTVGDKIRVDLMLSDARTSETLATINDTDNQTHLLDMVSRTGEKLREKLALRPLERAQEQRLQHAMSGDARANRFYFDGLASLKLGDGPEAQKQLSLAVETDPNFALAHSALSGAWSQLGYNARARTEAKLALDLGGAGQSREDRLVMEAGYDSCLSDWNKAAETYRSLWRFFPDNSEYGLSLAEMEYAAGSPADALKAVKVLRTMPAPGSQDPRIDLLESHGAQIAGDYQRAYQLTAEAARKAEASKARILLARARMQQGVNTNRLGRLDEARQNYAQAKALFEAVGDLGDAADAQQADAATLRAMGKIEESINESEAALAMSRKIGFTRLTCRILAAYANTLIRKGSLDSASKASEEALALNSGINDVGISFSGHMDRGRIAKAQGRYKDARADFVESVRIANQAGYRLNQVNAASILGLLDASMGRLSDARKEFEDVVAKRRTLGNQRQLFLSLADLASVDEAQGDLPAARRLHEEECNIAEALPSHQGLADCRLQLARLAWYEGREPDARAALARLSQDFKPGSFTADGLVRLAALRLETGDVKGAKESLAIAQRRASRQEMAPERSLSIDLVAARIDGSTARVQQVVSEAVKLSLVAVALEAQLGFVEMEPGGLRLADAKKLAADAGAKGFGLIANKASALAAPPPHKS
ncbi:MAG TPA: winged helix-turn-helix domain-containing protein [Bryobacteraceae bacterium]|jgi:DNA-binding winged helix-turn-helix (wHTH) protein/tetratricopeptide (TPR) repeat protein